MRLNPGFKIGVMTLATVAAFAGANAQPESNCFRLEDNRRAPFDVLQIAKPPPFVARRGDYSETSPYYPATAFATTTAAALSSPFQRSASGASFQRYYLQWVNRCINIPGETPGFEACRNLTRSKGNGYVGMALAPLAQQVRPQFTTYAKANACTVAQITAVLGHPQDDIAASGRKAGIVVLANRDTDAIAARARRVTPANGRPQTALVDTCVLDSDRLADDVGAIVLDYEVWDDRTPGEVVTFMRELRAIVAHSGRKLVLSTNPLPRAPNGLIAGHVRAVLAEVDGFAPTLSSGATKSNADIGLSAKERTHSPWQSYVDQLAVLTDNGARPLTAAERAKIIWTVPLYDVSLEEGRRLHEEFRRQKYRGVSIFRAYVKQGGACDRPSNQLTACLAFGACDGNFGRDR